MSNEFDKHGNATTTAIGALLTGGVLLLGALGKKIKEKADEKKEEVILETDKYKISKKK